MAMSGQTPALTQWPQPWAPLEVGPSPGVVLFHLVEGEGATVVGPFPASPQLGSHSCSGRLWRPRTPLHSFTPPLLLRACACISRGTSSPLEHPRPQLGLTGLPSWACLRPCGSWARIRGAGQAARKPVCCSPLADRHRAAQTSSGLQGFRLGFGSRTQRRRSLGRRGALRGSECGGCVPTASEERGRKQTSCG